MHRFPLAPFYREGGEGINRKRLICMNTKMTKMRTVTLVSLTLLLCVKLQAQTKVCQYHNAILHIQQDSQIRHKVESLFGRLGKPIVYHVADSLTFIDLWLHEYDPTYGFDSLAFGSNNAFYEHYFFENIDFFHLPFEPSANSIPLHLFMSKRIGNCIFVDIKEDDTYPISQKIRFGNAILVCLLVDEYGNIIKNQFVWVINHN